MGKEISLMEEDKVTESEETEMNTTTTIKRPCTPTDSLTKSIKEMKLMREGKLKKRSWKEVKDELNRN